MVAAVEKTWESIRRRHPDVPPVVVSVGQGMITKEAKLGHFAARAWQHGEDQVSELFLDGENLQAEVSTVLTTLLHEAAHGIAHTRGIKDTSRQGRYHNERYRALAVEVGLEVSQHGQFGWTLHDGLPELTAARYRAELNRLSATLVAHRRSISRAGSDGRKDNNNGISAECGCPRKIRTSRASWAAGPILCAVCSQPFRSPTEPDPDA
jgi:hypothetical protein